MRPNADCSLTAREVHERAVAVLLFAAARLRSVRDACGRLRDVPGDDTVRAAWWPECPRRTR
jgi:hypothetical protein